MTRFHWTALLTLAATFGCAATGAPAHSSVDAGLARSSPAPAPAPAEPGTGSSARGAPLVVHDMQGVERNLGATLASGKKVALVFWQTWCAPCIQEAPNLVAAARAHASTIEFVGVVAGPDDAVDDQEVRAMTTKLQLPYPQVRDRDLALTTRYGVKATPTIVVLGKDAKVLYFGHRSPADWASL